MAIITIDKASLAFGSHPLLTKVSFGVEKGDKIGLIGRNGSGKSSLLKAMAGIIDFDDGQRSVSDGTKIIYVPQEPILDPAHTIAAEILSGFGKVKELLNEYYALLDLLAHNTDAHHLERLNTLQEALDHSNAWGVTNLIDKILSELNLDGTVQIEALSGGMKKKVAIAKALINNPDVMLLDEPTNHLDITTTIWLENVIRDFPGSVVLITHDRSFLDNTVDKIIELDRGRLNVYPDSYAKYLLWKVDQLQVEAKINQEFDKVLAKEEVWIRKGIEARRTRNEGRVRRLEQLRIDRQNRRERVGQVKFGVDSGNASGKIVADLEKVNVSFADKVILRNFSTTVLRGDKIGLIGPNGIGKSTLLKVLLGHLKADSGKVVLGTKIQVAYFDQFRVALDEKATIQDVVSQGEDFVEVNGRKLHIATYLEEFLFSPDRFRSPVKALSGGERNRLLLARLFSRPANVLVLDEPTNDLDIETLELLEELLVNYSGTIFLVSHDRTFLDNVVTESLVFLGDGEVLEIAGGYSDWLDYSKKYPRKASTPTAAPASDPRVKPESDNKTMHSMQTIHPNSKKLSYKEKQELDGIMNAINTLEQEQQSLNQQLLDDNLYKTSPEKARSYQASLSMIETEIIEKLARWEYLEGLK